MTSYPETENEYALIREYYVNVSQGRSIGSLHPGHPDSPSSRSHAPISHNCDPSFQQDSEIHSRTQEGFRTGNTNPR